MSLAARHDDHPPAPPTRSAPRLHVVGPAVDTPPGTPVHAGPQQAYLPTLRLRALPQPQPQPWSPQGWSDAGTRGYGRDGDHPAQGAFVLHGVTAAVTEPAFEDPVATPRGDLPCPEQLARRLVQAAVDVVRGHRPATQVLRWTTPEVYSQLRQRARLEQAGRTAGPGRRPVVRSLRVQPGGATGVEVSAVVLDGARARAVAARLEGQDSRWRLTALVIG